MRELSMEEMKKVIGQNIMRLRRAASMTQSQLAEELNYSDKAVSKWECGDAVPDIFILTRIATLFGVTVDFLVSEEHEKETVTVSKSKDRVRWFIILLSFTLVWLIATGVYVVCSIFYLPATNAWMAFIYAIPVSILVVFILSCVWRKRLCLYLSLSLFLWACLLALYLTIIVFSIQWVQTPWLIFVLGIPGQVIIALWPGLRQKLYLQNKSKKKATATTSAETEETTE